MGYLLYLRDAFNAYEGSQHTHNLSFHPVCSYTSVIFTDALAKRDIAYLSLMLSLTSTKY